LRGSAWSAAEAGFDDVAPMHLGTSHAEHAHRLLAGRAVKHFPRDLISADVNQCAAVVADVMVIHMSSHRSHSIHGLRPASMFGYLPGRDFAAVNLASFVGQNPHVRFSACGVDDHGWILDERYVEDRAAERAFVATVFQSHGYGSFSLGGKGRGNP